MTSKQRKRLILVTAGVVLLALIVYGFLPDPVLVETATVRHGPMEVVLEEDGETRVAQRFDISSPTVAFMRRIMVEPGDAVESGQALVYLEPPRANLLDPRTRAEAQGRIVMAEAGLAQARENLRAADAAAGRAAEERRRAERLHEAGSATNQMVEQAVSAALQAEASRDAAAAGVTAAQAELAAAQSTLATEPGGGDPLPVRTVIRAPARARVLAVHRESEGMVSPGEPLLSLGDTDALQVRVSVLSQDAVRIVPGTRVWIDQWGGDSPLAASVARVEPQGFTRISSLGVEEQRVPVMVNVEAPDVAASGLGSGFRVLARFILWEAENVLQVPASALFRSGDGWAVFVVERDVAVRREVEIGRQSGLSAQVLDGLAEGETVIVHPGRTVEDGVKVEAR